MVVRYCPVDGQAVIIVTACSRFRIGLRTIRKRNQMFAKGGDSTLRRDSMAAAEKRVRGKS